MRNVEQLATGRRRVNVTPILIHSLFKPFFEEIRGDALFSRLIVHPCCVHYRVGYLFDSYLAQRDALR